jgi:N12 class adenine-specific DNA methylase
VTFATGTPISNTMVEMYTMQRFLDPEGLEVTRH